jgi:hypothetical protein
LCLTSQDNGLCIFLWTIRENSLVSACPAVDERVCGNVDNRSGAQVANRAQPEPRTGPLEWVRTLEGYQLAGNHLADPVGPAFDS